MTKASRQAVLQWALPRTLRDGTDSKQAIIDLGFSIKEGGDRESFYPVEVPEGGKDVTCGEWQGINVKPEVHAQEPPVAMQFYVVVPPHHAGKLSCGYWTDIKVEGIVVARQYLNEKEGELFLEVGKQSPTNPYALPTD